jgi:3-oxoacyl-[acyl-carrier-protein] synthase-3
MYDNETKNEMSLFIDAVEKYFTQVKTPERSIDLPTTKWFTNLSSVGNIGAASPFVALNGLIETKCLKKGDTILLIVPESGRFSCGTALLKYV